MSSGSKKRKASEVEEKGKEEEGGGDRDHHQHPAPQTSKEKHTKSESSEQEPKNEEKKSENEIHEEKRPAKKRKTSRSSKKIKTKKSGEAKKSGPTKTGTKRKSSTKKTDSKTNVAEIPAEMKKLNWRELSIIGIEEGAEDEIHKKKWEFPELQEALETGFLSNKKYPLYVFMGAQPVSLGSDNVFNVPYVVVVDCAVPLCDRIAYTSIQSASEEIVPMKSARVSWTPYRPKGFENRPELPSQIIYLAVERRRVSKEKLNAERLHKLSFLLPYELLPQTFENESLEQKLEGVRTVDFVYKTKDGRKVEFNWDKDIHFLSKGDLKMMMEEEKIPESEHDEVKAKLKEAFEKKRAVIKKDHEEKQKILASYSPKHIEALKNIKIYKFYPTCPGYNIKKFMVPVVNRYFGDATKVLPVVENGE
jgi:hypothetical protein